MLLHYFPEVNIENRRANGDSFLYHTAGSKEQRGLKRTLNKTDSTLGFKGVTIQGSFVSSVILNEE